MSLTFVVAGDAGYWHVFRLETCTSCCIYLTTIIADSNANLGNTMMKVTTKLYALTNDNVLIHTKQRYTWTTENCCM